MNDARNEIARASAATVFWVDDEGRTRKRIESALRRGGFDVRRFEKGSDALEALIEIEGRVDVVVAGLDMPGIDGLALSAEVRQRWPDVSVVLVAERANAARAVEAVHRGAYDCIADLADGIEPLIYAVTRAIEHTRLVRRNEYLEQRLNVAERFEEIDGDSEPMRYVYQLVESVASTDVTVLILGETGTGKELVARSIHRRSARKVKPFVAIDCGALAEDRLEMELFGHERGVVNGAAPARRDLVEAAHGGTLFLNEVGDLGMGTQAKLLRVLEDGEVRRVGSDETRKVDVRVIAASTRMLSEEVKAGKFHEDLFYRLNVVTIRVPPLRDRRGDIPLVAMSLLRRLSERHDKRIDTIAPSALVRLCTYSWPGNVRELMNAIERAVVSAGSSTITEDALPKEIRVPAGVDTLSTEEPRMPFTEARSLFEMRYLSRALERASGNVAEAARLAGLDRSNFRRLLKRHGLEPRPRTKDRGGPA